ncbi:class I SAM-dependent methyltransferase, partial [Crocinitomix catalasitica]|nr:class I SAM-dependent methyltransferase [Crocinitomix catalasitica]
LNEGDKFLNLFGYTAVASIVARSLGADVFHCDSVKQIIGWGKQNMESSGLADIHWVLEDVLKFAQREQKRGHKYKGIIMDPPAYGIGAKGERWKIENKIEELISLAKELTISNGFVILNTYSPKLRAEKILEMCHNYFNRSNVQVDTLCMKSTSGKVIEYGLRTKIRVV